MIDQNYQKDLWSQLKDNYGKLQYTYVTHQKKIWLVELKQSFVSWAQIVLTAISSVGFLSIVFANNTGLVLAAGICSVISLALNLYSRSAKIGDELVHRRKTVDSLWTVVQDYISLLTDFWNVENIETIKARRQELQDKTIEIYKDAPRTGKLAYSLARKALKANKEQSFEGDETDALLPDNLRNRG